MTLLNFQEELILKGINPSQYLSIARKKARELNLNYNSLVFSENIKFKLRITNPSNNEHVYFGATEYNDFIIYSLLAKQQKITQGEANKHKWLFHERMIVKDDNPYSARNLSLRVTW
jgi:hypothetical protein